MANSKICFVDFPLRNFVENSLQGIQLITTDYHLNMLLRVFIKVPLLKSLMEIEKRNWVEDCKLYDTVILFDLHKNYAYYADKIEKVIGADARLILYLLNPISFSDDYKELSKRWEIWSFSEEDASKHSLKYGETLYDPNIPKAYEDIDINKDVFFIGTEKGRGEIIRDVRKRLSFYGLVVDIRIADNKKYLYNHKYSRYLNYNENCKEVASTKMLLEIVQEGQSGLTLRTMEALYFGKKLITNNKYIKRSILYKPTNYFVIGDDKWEDFDKFVSGPYQPNPDGVKREFSFDRWMERLLNNIEFGGNE